MSPELQEKIATVNTFLDRRHAAVKAAGSLQKFAASARFGAGPTSRMLTGQTAGLESFIRHNS